MYRVWTFVSTYSLLMVLGAVLALIWANLDPASHHAFAEAVLWEGGWIGEPTFGPDGEVLTRSLTVAYLSKDVLMALFFAVAGKEVWEAVALRDGSLRGRKALVPLLSAVGGMAAPVAVYLLLAALLGSATWDALAHGWAVPTATDIALSFIVARIVFGPGHPAVLFLLLLAIVDDALGLLIIAVFYPKGALQPEWLLLSAGAVLLVWLLCNRLPLWRDRGDPLMRHSTWMRTRLSFWPYALAGAASWYAFQEAGLHPSLGLLPVIPAIPHADRDFGVYAATEEAMPDLLNRIEHALKVPVELILFFFGLVNAGVAVAALGAPTWLVLAGLLVGKPLGITLAAWLAARRLGLGLSEGMGLRDVLVVGFIASMGFTVALFVAGVAFSPDLVLNGVPVQDAARLGALLSVVGGLVAVVAARLLGVRRRPA